MRVISSKQKLIISTFALSLMTASTPACKPKSKSGLSAIVSADGNNATGLLPIRQRFLYGVSLSPAIASMVQDAMRLSYGAVECYGGDSAAVFNFLEDVTRYSSVGLKREGNQIYIPNQAFYETVSATPKPSIVQVASKHLTQDGPYKKLNTDTCRLIGEHTLNMGSFVALMADPAVDFDSKQLIWLAARGRADGGVNSFSGTFYKFLRENIGATPSADQANNERTLTAIDNQFNPCFNSNVAKNFTCDANKNYRVTGSYSDTLSKFLDLVKSKNESYLTALSQGNGEAKDAAAGLRVAAMVSGSIMTSSFITKDVPQGTAPAPSASSSTKIHPAIAVMFGQLPRIQLYFSIRIGTEPGYVYDPENPVKLPQELRIASAAQQPRFALTEESEGLNLADAATDAPASAAAPENAPAASAAAPENAPAASAAAPERSEPASAAAPENAPAASAATQVKEEQPPQNANPVRQGDLISTANIQGVKGDEAGVYWKRDPKDTSHFIHEEGGRVVSESRAVQRTDGTWSYVNTRFDANNQPMSQKVLFLGAKNLAGGAGAGTFVEYDVDGTSMTTDRLKSADLGQLQNASGRIYTQNPDDRSQTNWLKFSAQKTADMEKPLTIQDSNSSLKDTVEIKPFQFTDPTRPNQAMYYSQSTTNPANSHWVTLAPIEQPKVKVDKPVAPVPPNDQEVRPAPNTAGVSPEVAKKEEEKRIEVVKTENIKQKVDDVKKQKEQAAWMNLPKLGESFDAMKKKVLSEYGKLQDMTDKASALAQKPDKTDAEKEELKKLEKEIPVQELAVTKSEIEDYGVNNAPKLGQVFTPTEKKVLDEKNKQKAAQEEMIRLKEQNASQQKILEQQIKVEAERLAVAKAEQGDLSQKFGPRYTRGSLTERWNPFGKAYDKPNGDAYDRWNKDQVTKMDTVQRRISTTDQTLAELERQLRQLRGDGTAQNSVQRSNAGT
jgi:hypothetical protein